MTSSHLPCFDMKLFRVQGEVRDDESVESDYSLAPPVKSSFDEVMQKRIYKYEQSHKALLATGCGRILIVDDESTCLMGIRGLLKSFKINVDKLVDVATTGLEAVKSIQSALDLGVDYQIVFTDISMPEMDGLEAAEKIREMYQT